MRPRDDLELALPSYILPELPTPRPHREARYRHTHNSNLTLESADEESENEPSVYDEFDIAALTLDSVEERDTTFRVPVGAEWIQDCFSDNRCPEFVGRFSISLSDIEACTYCEHVAGLGHYSLPAQDKTLIAKVVAIGKAKCVDIASYLSTVSVILIDKKNRERKTFLSFELLGIIAALFDVIKVPQSHWIDKSAKQIAYGMRRAFNARRNRRNGRKSHDLPQPESRQFDGTSLFDQVNNRQYQTQQRQAQYQPYPDCVIPDFTSHQLPLKQFRPIYHKSSIRPLIKSRENVVSCVSRSRVFRTLPSYVRRV
jgi:hypothetical protein